MEREISRSEVIDTLMGGEIIAVYPDDRPLPSALIHKDQPPLHVGAAMDVETATCFVITAYRPDDTHFEPDLKSRRTR